MSGPSSQGAAPKEEAEEAASQGPAHPSRTATVAAKVGVMRNEHHPLSLRRNVKREPKH